jgi:uncharacterized protein YgiM (DUF1202 family)
VGRPVAVEELAAEALRRLFLRPGADHYSRFVEELTKGDKLALMLERGTSRLTCLDCSDLRRAANSLSLRA